MTATNGHERAHNPSPSYPYRYAEQYSPPEPERASDVAITTFEHVYEVDPRLMQRWVLQQSFPNWDSLRIMAARQDHLEWMHRHFASTVVTGSDLLADIDAEDAADDGAVPPTPPSTAAPDQEAPR